MDLTVLERYRASLTWLQQHDFAVQNNSYSVPAHLQALINGNINSCSVNGDVVLDWSKKPEHYFGTTPPFSKFGHLSIAAADFVPNTVNSLEIGNCCLSRTPSSCQVSAVEVVMNKEVAAVAEEGGGGAVAVVEKMETSSDRISLSKRKAEFVEAVECKDNKMMKREVEEGPKVKEKSSTETSADTSKDNSKASEVKKPDFIHVRARRGQATDSHSLAERARREKISKKMKCLQDLVPGCNKITGKAGMLDEIINYVQSLQRQVEFLSMKLAALNPRVDCNIENFSAKELPAYVASFPAATSLSSAMANLPYSHLNPVQQGSANCVLDAPMHHHQSQTPVHQLCLQDSSCFSQQVQTFSHWDTDLQSFYNNNNLGFHQG